MKKKLYKLRYNADEVEWRAQAKRFLISKFIKKYLTNSKYALKVLDFGCGTGLQQVELEKKFSNIVSFGLDTSPDAIKLSKKRGLKNISLYSGKKIPFRNNFFDFVIAADVLEHISDDLFSLREIKRVLKVGGFGVFLVPAHQKFWSDRDLMLKHFRRYEGDELEKKSKKFNLKVMESKYVDFLLYFLFWVLIKKAQKKSGVKQVGWETAKVHPLLNKILYLYQILEYQFLNFFSFPVGLAQIVVVKK